MKKLFAVCLVMAMMLCMSINVFAAPGSFVSSPSGNPAPELVSFDPADDQCTAQLIITAYADRSDLSDDLKALLETAYKAIAETDDITKLNADLAKLAADNKLDTKKLAVGDLFDAHVEGCTTHDGHVSFKITIKADSLDRFVGLLHMDANCGWELVSDAEVSEDGKTLTFTATSLSPFAIVVNTDENLPATGDNSKIATYLIIMAVAAVAFVVVFAASRKKQKAQ